jgi:hypothetical protein
MNSHVADGTVFTRSAVNHFNNVRSCLTAPQKYLVVFDEARYEIEKVGLLVGWMNGTVVDSAGVRWNVVDAAKCKALSAYEEAYEKMTKEVPVEDPTLDIEELYDDEEYRPDSPMPAPTSTESDLNKERANKARAILREQENMVKFCGLLDQCYPMFVQYHLNQGDIRKVKAWCPCGRGGKFWRKSVLVEDDDVNLLEGCSNDRVDRANGIINHCLRNGGPKHAAVCAYLTFLHSGQQGLHGGLSNYSKQQSALSAYLRHDIVVGIKAETSTSKEEDQVDRKPAAAACQQPTKKQTQVDRKPAAVACASPVKKQSQDGHAMERETTDQHPATKKIKIKSAAGDAKDPVIID